MSLSRKFVIVLVSCILSIAILNILAFYMFYSSYIRLYLSEKISSRQDVTIEYINSIIEKQTLEDIDTIFSDAELEFFDLLDISDGTINLWEGENVNIVVDFLVKSWVSPKYIEEVIPENNLEKVLDSLKNPDSPESNFIRRLIVSLIIINFIFLTIFWVWVWYFTRKIILPIKKATNEIKTLQIWSKFKKIDYKKKDEIWLLIQSINNLNTKLSVQETIRSRLLADISHELKTPITSIQCYLEGIIDGVISLSSENLASITGEMKRLTDLVNQIMEYEQFENTDLELTKISTNMYDFISPILDTQQIYLQKNKQLIGLSWSKNMEALIDRDTFTQLVYNIVWNFVKYAGKNARLDIHISSNTLTFSDNWSGISKREIPFISEKFYQGKIEKTWKSTQRGIWIGLSMVKKIIEAHDWKYVIASDSWKWFSIAIDL